MKIRNLATGAEMVRLPLGRQTIESEPGGYGGKGLLALFYGVRSWGTQRGTNCEPALT